MSVLSSILDSTKETNFRERLMMYFFAGSAVSLTFLPHFGNFSRQANTLSLAGGIFSTSSYLALVSSRKNKEKIIGALEAAKLQSIKVALADQLTQESIETEVRRTQRLRDYITSLPIEEQPLLVEKYQLQGMIAPEYEPETEFNSIMETPTVTPQLPFDEVYSARTEIDYSWLNPEFFLSPQVLVGVSGSGKTSLMALIAKWFVTVHPEGELRIGDLHYDEKLSLWLPGIPPKELLRKYLCEDTESIINLFYYAEKLLDERIKNKQQGAKPFKLMCDEFVGFMNRLDKKMKERIIGIMKKINFEGRKYGVTLTLGLHSTKKEETGIDSSVLANFYQLWLKDSIDDSTTVFSRSFDMEALTQEKNQLKTELRQGEGYPAVLKPRGEAPRVVILPHIHPDDLRVNYPETPPPKRESTVKPTQEIIEDDDLDDEWGEETEEEIQDETPTVKPKAYPLEDLLQWYLGYSTPPLESAIKEKWHELTGVWLTDAGFQLVQEKLNEIKGRKS